MEKSTLKNFTLRLIKFYLVILSISIFIYFFSRHNLISDFTAKLYIRQFEHKNLTIKTEITEERRVAYQVILKNNNKHFKHLIIGSSRVLQFGKFTSFDNALNVGVSGANYEDIKYLYDLSQKNNISFDTIIFDFNPWLTIANTDSRYKQFYLKNRLSLAVKDILKFNYTVTDLSTVYGFFNGYKNCFQETKPEEIENKNVQIKFSDGSIQQKQNDHSTRKRLIKGFSRDLYQMANFDSINTARFNQVINLYSESGKKGCCIVTLTPFHFDFYSKNKKDRRVQNAILSEQKLRAVNSNFIIKGSFVPQNIGVIETDFLDGFHLNETAIYKIFKN